ncbi:MAG TPA: class II glutamine amidotransferase [Thermoleophilaceae bacterium]|nr:class II glutamine amidotransferase [Thermoleophilaceae bacterium]
MAWSGQPLIVEELLFAPPHGLVDQSRHSRLGVETTNGDGFGLGWYGAGDGPAVYRSIAPAWGDENLRELAAHVESPLFIAHVRATTGTAIQQTNCHPFRHGRWLFVHNGAIARFEELRRDLMLAIDPSLFPAIQGSTDSEVVFNLALSFGLDGDPIAAVERAIGYVEAIAERRGVPSPVQASMGLTDGERLWAFRYSSEGKSRSLFSSCDAAAVRRLHPENERLQRLRDEDRVVVSEPVSDLPGVWESIPESTVLIVQPGDDQQRPFRPVS